MLQLEFQPTSRHVSIGQNVNVVTSIGVIQSTSYHVLRQSASIDVIVVDMCHFDVYQLSALHIVQQQVHIVSVLTIVVDSIITSIPIVHYFNDVINR